MRRLNEDVYYVIAEAGMKVPDIPVRSVEFYGQCAEDLIVCSLLRSIAGRRKLDMSKERFLEIGANHPVATSATYLLSRHFGMAGVLVEPNPYLVPDLERYRPRDIVVNVAIHARPESEATLFICDQSEISSLEERFVQEWANGAVGVREKITVKAMRLNEFIDTHFEKCPIFLSLDVEGIDLEILEDIDWNKYRPAIIQVEPSDQFRQNNSDDIQRCFVRNDYQVICQTSVNIIAIDLALITERCDEDSTEVSLLRDAVFRAKRERDGLRSALADLTAQSADSIVSLQDRVRRLETLVEESRPTHAK